MQKISPFLWFDSQAEEAALFYTAIFPNSSIGKISRYPEGCPAPAGSVMVVEFNLDVQPFSALNCGPQFQFSPAISLMVHCDSQSEIDHYWDRLSEGGAKSRCGWLDDKFGVSWQVVPRRLGELASDPDPVKAGRVMHAMMTMGKMDIAALEAAHQGIDEP